jgi:hypothetical protein
LPKITDKELEAIQVRLFKDDLNYLRKLYGGQQFGVNKVIRTIVHTFVTQTIDSANRAIDTIEAKDLVE